MKVSEIINERINIAKYSGKLYSRLLNAVARGYYLYIPYGMKSIANTDPEFIRVPPIDIGMLSSALATSLTKEITEWLHSIGMESVHVEFIDLGTYVKGRADTDHSTGKHTVELSTKFLQLLSRHADSIYNNYADGSAQNMIDAANRNMTKSGASVLQIYTDDEHKENVQTMVGTIVHEVTHLKQHEPQQDKINNGLDDYEYRSNKQRNLGKFLYTKRDMGPNIAANQWYRASPQEIDAFAQGTLTELLLNAGVQDFEDYEEITQDQYNRILQNINAEFKNLKAGLSMYAGIYKRGKFGEENRQDDLARNKYYKRIALGLNDVIEELKNKVI